MIIYTNEISVSIKSYFITLRGTLSLNYWGIGCIFHNWGNAKDPHLINPSIGASLTLTIPIVMIQILIGKSIPVFRVLQ